jgi:hypothetical protein
MVPINALIEFTDLRVEVIVEPENKFKIIKVKK